MGNASSPLKIRFLILLLLAGVLFSLAPEPNDLAALTTLQDKPLTTSNLLGTRTQTQSISEVRPGRHDAEVVLRRTISRRPLDPQPWRLLGDLYADRGQPDDALDAYGQAISRGNDEAAMDQSLARLYADLGDDRQAHAHWTKYLARRPDDRVARLALVWTDVRLADWRKAIANMEQLLIDHRDDLIAHAWLGLLQIGPNALEGTVHLQRAAEDPELGRLLAPVLAAQSHSASGDNPAYRSALLGVALLDLDVSALLYDPAAGPGIEGQPLVEAQQAVTTLALRSLLAATHRSPAYADAYAYLGQALDQLGWSGWARTSLNRALELAPQSPVVQTLLGLYWDRRGASALARHYYETAFLQDQGNLSLCLEISDTYSAEGNYTAAEVWLFYAAEIAPSDAQVWEALARFYLDFGIGVEQSGLTAARRLLTLTPDDARAHDLLGWAHFLAGEYDHARTSLTQALTIDPSLASAHFHLGRLQAHLGYHNEASLAYRRAADADTGQELTTQLERAWMELPETFQDGP